MLPDARFTGREKTFWANIRTISQSIGYAARDSRPIKVPSERDLVLTMHKLGLSHAHLYDDGTQGLTNMGRTLLDYFTFRADCLNDYVRPRLMDADQARSVYEETRVRLNPQRQVPMNKQKGQKKAPAYLTGLVNMVIEANGEGLPCDYNPGLLTTFTRDVAPLRTLARRVDGCFTSTVNPVAVWEIKGYYYTTTFGSRIADGVYETLLDGLELEELAEHERVGVRHILVVDAYYTWWVKGRSYLCRLIDMLHMGYVDEVLFGYEVVERLPGIVREWVHLEHDRLSGNVSTSIPRENLPENEEKARVNP